ncbi:MAG: hypothetical protein JWM67_1673, partial [Mycobacterium sp.]|nr:hypothetical protein [Mycobacterium sp.]
RGRRSRRSGAGGPAVHPHDEGAEGDGQREHGDGREGGRAGIQARPP